MKSVLSFILVAALVFSASAGAKEAFEVLKGFATGLNHAELNPAIQNCSDSVVATYEAFANLSSFVHGLDSEDKFEQASSQLMVNIVHTVRVCAKIHTNLASFLDSIAAEIKHCSGSEMTSRLFSNMFNINMKIMQAKASIDAKDYKAAGVVIAEVFKLVAYGSVDGPNRTIRQLSSYTQQIRNKVSMDANSTFLGFLGFIEEANTTFGVSDYLQFTNDTTVLINLVNTLEVAVQKMDIMTIMACLQNMTGAYQVVNADLNVLSVQAINFVERDLPLFNTPAQMQKVSTYLFANLPAVMMAAQRVIAAYNNADYRETGHGVGGFYNLLRTAATA